MHRRLLLSCKGKNSVFAFLIFHFVGKQELERERIGWQYPFLVFNEMLLKINSMTEFTFFQQIQKKYKIVYNNTILPFISLFFTV